MANDDREEIARGYLPEMERLVRQLTRKYAWLRDEAYSEGLVAVVVAMREFDPGRGASFPAFAAMLVRHRFLELLRRSRLEPAVEWHAHGRDDLGQAIDPPCRESYPVGWEVDYDDWVRGLSRRLPPRHGEMLRRHYLEAAAAGLDACASLMGIKPGRAGELHAESLAMLGESLGARPRASNRAGERRGKARESVADAARSLAAEGRPVTIAAVAARSGISAGHVGSFRRDLIREGLWPARDGRASNSGGYWQDRRDSSRSASEHMPRGDAA